MRAPTPAYVHWPRRILLPAADASRFDISATGGAVSCAESPSPLTRCTSSPCQLRFCCTTRKGRCEACADSPRGVIQFSGHHRRHAAQIRAAGHPRASSFRRTTSRACARSAKIRSILLITDGLAGHFTSSLLWFAPRRRDFAGSSVSPFAERSSPVTCRRRRDYEQVIITASSFLTGLTFLLGHPLAMGAIEAGTGSHGRGAHRRQRLHHRRLAGRAMHSSLCTIKHPKIGGVSQQGRVLGRGMVAGRTAGEPLDDATR